ncbi:MAG: PilZ domain-containing protein [Planctomycetota bacterium]|nr:MAG: PilZ domain-containing protein [Planctomycetota bacterium]
MDEDTREQNRRRFRRLDADVKVEIAYTEPEGTDRLVAYQSANLSASGVLIEVDIELPVGTLLIARFMLPDRERPISFLTEVVRVEPTGGDSGFFKMGMNFTNVTPEGLKDLDEILARTFGGEG